MLTILTVIHIIIGVVLMVFILLQDPKEGAMGVFGGGSSSSSFFGSSGGSTFLTSATKWTGVLFAISCLTLTYITTRKGSSVMDKLPDASAPITAPATPSATTPAAPSTTAPAATAPSTPTETAPAKPADAPKK